MQSQLILEDGTRITGDHFGAEISVAGEVVFNTGMVGYPETMTDPSYRGQILVFTYPLIGNYGVPVNEQDPACSIKDGLSEFLESYMIHVKGIVISRLTQRYSHWAAIEALEDWMRTYHVPGVTGVDTRALTRRLRSKGTMLGKLVVNDVDIDWEDPNERHVVAEVSVTEPVFHPAENGDKKVVLVDVGCKDNIVRSLNKRGIDVVKVPWNYDWTGDEMDGVFLSNGPGDPKMCSETITILKKGFERKIPIMGICLGHQLMCLAAGGDTYKLKFGHRSQNQPCIEAGSKRCYITSQNHGYAVDAESLGPDWLPWFFNANDGTNEGSRHKEKPIYSVQFHPEANPGPVDTNFLFDEFAEALVLNATGVSIT